MMPGVFVQRSTDDGANWSSPEEITAQVKPDDWGWYATGPCHGIVLAQGPYAGRLVPANHSFIPSDSHDLDTAEAIRLNGGHCIYSDDGGRTWSRGFVDRNDGAEINANETTVTELADGRLYLTVFVSDDAGQAWRPGVVVHKGMAGQPCSDRTQTLGRPHVRLRPAGNAPVCSDLGSSGHPSVE
jgi:sialidase-1